MFNISRFAFEMARAAANRIRPSRGSAPRAGLVSLPLLTLLTALSCSPAAQAATVKEDATDFKGTAQSAAVLDDAQRFATLFKVQDGRPSAEALQSTYLAPGTPGIAIFTTYRIKDAANLARHIAGAQADYQHALDLCWPEAQRMQGEVSRTITQVGGLLGSPDAAPVYFLFGANNSGGTATPEGLAIGLEVICKDVQTPAQAQQIIREFVAHEMTHVFQVRHGLEMHEHDLLQHVLSEGVADFVMGQVLGSETTVDAARRAHGLAHEAELWQHLQADLAADKGDGYWLFNGPQARAGVPPDMGYWLGRRICET